MTGVILGTKGRRSGSGGKAAVAFIALVTFGSASGAVACNAITGASDISTDEDGDSANGKTSGHDGSGSGQTGSGGAGQGGGTGTASGGSTTGGAENGGATSSNATAGNGATTGSGGLMLDEAATELCVNTINDYRATLNLPAYTRWTSAELCTSEQALSDSQSGQAHGAFGQCGEFAQNECPGWSGPPGAMIENCLAQMWAEGPGADFNLHGHYINMSSENYTQVSCGFYITPSGSVWAIQNFK